MKRSCACVNNLFLQSRRRNAFYFLAWRPFSTANQSGCYVLLFGSHLVQDTSDCVCALSRQRVYTPQKRRCRHYHGHEFPCTCSVPRLDYQGERHQGVGAGGARVESLPRRVTISPREPVFLGRGPSGTGAYSMVRLATLKGILDEAEIMRIKGAITL